MLAWLLHGVRCLLWKDVHEIRGRNDRNFVFKHTQYFYYLIEAAMARTRVRTL